MPTEAEWEYACRSGGKEETCSGGSNVDGVGWYGDNSNSQTHPAGTKGANGLGIHDMSGNVREWVQDIHAPYPVAAQTDPVVESGGAGRVRRGGSWNDDARYLRCVNRFFNDPAYRISIMGFRLARTP